MTWDDSDAEWPWDVIERPWWEIVFEGEQWDVDDAMMCETLGPEYFFALDRGLQP